MIKKLGMVILLEHKFDEAIEFYQNLGFKLIFQLKNQWAEFRLGDLKIGLCPTKTVFEEHRTGLVFEVNDLEIFYETHKGKIPFLNAPITKIHGIMVGLKDPSGNVIDLYQPTPERLEDLIKTIKASDAPENNSAKCNRGHACCKKNISSNVCAA